MANMCSGPAKPIIAPMTTSVILAFAGHRLMAQRCPRRSLYRCAPHRLDRITPLWKNARRCHLSALARARRTHWPARLWWIQWISCSFVSRQPQQQQTRLLYWRFSGRLRRLAVRVGFRAIVGVVAIAQLRFIKIRLCEYCFEFFELVW